MPLELADDFLQFSFRAFRSAAVPGHIIGFCFVEKQQEQQQLRCFGARLRMSMPDAGWQNDEQSKTQNTEQQSTKAPKHRITEDRRRRTSWNSKTPKQQFQLTSLWAPLGATMNVSCIWIFESVVRWAKGPYFLPSTHFRFLFRPTERKRRAEIQYCHCLIN